MKYYLNPEYSGSSDGSLSQPFSKRDQLRLEPGDEVLTKRGTVTDDGKYSITVPSIWGAYGDGALPIYTGNGDIVFTPFQDVEISDIEFRDARRGIASIDAVVNVHDCVFNNCDIDVSIICRNKNLHGLSVRDNTGRAGNNAIWIRLDSPVGMHVSGIDLVGNDLRGYAQHGIRVQNMHREITDNYVSGVTLEYNEVHDCGKAGASIGYVRGGGSMARYNRMSGNSNNETTGNLQFFAAPDGILIEHNECWDARTSGIDGVDILLDASQWGDPDQPTPGVDNAIVRYNYSHDSNGQPYTRPDYSGAGIFVLKGNNNEIYGNRVSRNNNGIHLGKFCAGNNVHSNLVDNIIQSPYGNKETNDQSQIHDNFTLNSTTGEVAVIR